MELSEHEKSLAPLLSPENRALLAEFSDAQRQGLAKHVHAGNVAVVQAAIGRDEEIERVLFWDKGGKFDDPDWQALKPLDELNAELMKKAAAFYKGKRLEAVKSQRKQDLALASVFNTGLLFSGLCGAIRCLPDGRPHAEGEYFQGVELRLIGSAGEHINSITIMPLGDRARQAVHFGPIMDQEGQGIRVNTHDPFSLIQLASLIHNDLPKAGYDPVLVSRKGRISVPVPSEVRKAVRKGVDLGLTGDLRLRVQATAGDIDQALEVAADLARVFYKRFGMETEIFNINHAQPNLFLLRNEQFDEVVDSMGGDDQGLVFMTYTLECRRCRRELASLSHLAASFPQVKFAMINMNAPHVKFLKKVFGDAAGGNHNDFAQSTSSTTPFSFVYKWRAAEGLTYQGFVATSSEQPPPSLELLKRKIAEYISTGACSLG